MREDLQLQRFQLVFKDSGLTIREFAKIFDTSAATMSRILRGLYPLKFHIIATVCFKLGYSSNWFILGVGHKKQKGEEAKLITEIQLLRLELDIITKLNLKLQARLTGVEHEYDDLKRKVDLLSDKKTG